MEELLQDPLTLVIVCAVIIVVLKLIKASVKLIVGACVLAAIVWAISALAPELAAAAVPATREVFACMSV